MFKEYEKDILWVNDNSSLEEKIPQLKEDEQSEIKLEDYDDIKTIDENRINLKNIYILKKRRASNELNGDELNKKKKKNPLETKIINQEKEEKNIIMNNSNNNIVDFMNNEKSSNNKSIEKIDKNMDLIIEPKYI